ncbi:MAG TPA: vitamin K epoxide reductase family protein, partial [Dehalococcoidia bacterium]|nr:vitamin K epoxide reductase family protein [Dehalococcoidia bacterium]
MSLPQTGRLPVALPWLALLVLSLPGMAASVYLTYSHYVDEPTVCAGIGSCEYVQTSEYSKVAGVPVALMGLGYFIAIAVLALARILRFAPALEWGTPVAFTMAIGGTAFVA